MPNPPPVNFGALSDNQNEFCSKRDVIDEITTASGIIQQILSFVS